MGDNDTVITKLKLLARVEDSLLLTADPLHGFILSLLGISFRLTYMSQVITVGSVPTVCREPKDE